MKNARSVPLAIATFLVLALILPLVMIDSVQASGGVATFLSLLVVWLSAARISVIVASGEPQLLALGFHLFVYPFLGLAALAQVTSGRFPLDAVTYGPGQVQDGLLMVLAGVVSFEVGCLLAARRRTTEESTTALGSDAGSPALGTSGPHWRLSQGRVVLLGLFGIVVLAYFVRDTGVAPFFSSREEAAQTLSGQTAEKIYELEDKTALLVRGIVLRIPVLLSLIALITMLRNGQWRAGRLGKPAVAVFLLALVVANVVANNPLSNTRFWFGVVTLGLVGTIVPWRTARGVRILAGSGLAVLILVFGLLDVFRRAVYDFALVGPRESYVTDGTYSGFQTILNGQTYLRAHELGLGTHVGSALLGFVPRSLWRSKPGDTGGLIDPKFNRSATLWTEFDVDFGIAGVIVGFVLVGIALTVLESRLSLPGAAFGPFLPALVGLVIFTLRGSLLSAMGTAYPLLLLSFLLMRRHAPPTRAKASQALGRPRRSSMAASSNRR